MNQLKSTLMKGKYNWKKQRDKKAFVALDDGTCFDGISIGSPTNQLGELVFNTGMSGYQEILSDPSYAGQIVTMTYPEIGNYGTNTTDMETTTPFAKGFIIHQLNQASNWRNEEELNQFLKNHNIPALAGVDTRALTLHLREKGTLKAYICTDDSISKEEASTKAKNWNFNATDYVQLTSTKRIYQWEQNDSKSKNFALYDSLPAKDIKLAVYDFGIKRNILRHLRGFGMDSTVYPASTPAEKILATNPDAIFLSNGPADPRDVTYAIDNTKKLIGKKPLMGICLGHQLLSLAFGCKIFKLKFGHHGCNHPIKNLQTGQIQITSQNHNYAVDPKSINQDEIKITHINLNDQTIAGIAHKKYPIFSVQHHPEAAPGPQDSIELFAQFRELVLKNK